ncbi:hypothetical protein PSACC_01866 [Paramicrosporidium saccamoebae]|uniref:Uncharacterized protein n=1 Tax=Paramicrosporidium saccamoebae TaxID=1246581 RepID=A0A2H9TKQ7_9FUNG|nr:hypothetical protein PSACC_01866 [Paramicrosporidium saccamoebae]
MGLEAPKLLVLVFLGCLTYIALRTQFSAKFEEEVLCGGSSCTLMKHRVLSLQKPPFDTDSADLTKDKVDKSDVEIDNAKPTDTDNTEIIKDTESTGTTKNTENIETNKNAEHVANTGIAANPGSAEHAKDTENAETIKNTEHAANTENVEAIKNIETNKNAEAIIPSKSTTDAKSIYCYYEKVYSGVDTMMKIWLRAWHMQGFHPRILSAQHAKLHPRYEYYMDAFAKHPTINFKQYEMTCYRRWLAFSAVGGGTFSDYDIMPFGPVSFPAIHNDSLQTYLEYAPMFTHAGPAGMERQLEFMANYSGRVDIREDGRKHLSDMIIMRYNMGFYGPLLKEPPLIHFSNREASDFCKFDPKCGKRERFAADTVLLGRLTARRVVMLTPPGVGVVDDPTLYGLGLLEERVKQLSAYLVQCSCRGFVAPYIPKSYEDTRVQFTHTFPTDFVPGDHLVFFAYDREMKNEYDPQTLQRLVELYNTPDVIPLKTSDPGACQTVIGYNLGWYCENNVIKFTSTKGPAAPWAEYEMFNGRFSELFDSYAALDKQLQNMQ